MEAAVGGSRNARHVRRHHIGFLALLVALGGTSYAAAKLPRNSVGSTQIRSGAVTRAMLAPAVRNQLTKPAVLGSPGTPGTPGAQGVVGPKGDTGASGAKGDLGPTAGAVRGVDTTTVTTGSPIGASLLPAILTTAAAGKVLVFATGTFAVTCAAACSRQITATVDGVPVPGVLGSRAVGIAVGVAAGQRTVRIVDQRTGNWSADFTSTDVRVVAVALGG